MNVGLSLALAAGSFAFTGEPVNAAIGAQVQPGHFAFTGYPATFTYNETPITTPDAILTMWLPTRLFTVTWLQDNQQMQFFDKKLPAEKNILAFDFTAGLESGATLTGTPTVSVSVYLGTDSNPTAILNGGSSISGNQVQVPVQAGLMDTMYLLEVDCSTTSGGITLGLQGVLPVGN
jgi:hypothetical protein